MPKYTTTIYADNDSANNPRDWENLGKMFCFHKRYVLGDKNELTSSQFNGWDEMESYLRKQYSVVLPMFMYDHSGVALSTSSFSCRYDSGQIGFIVASREEVLKCFGVKRLTKKVLESVAKALKGEVELYSHYVNGDVFSYTVEDEDGDVIGGCGGIIGRENLLEEIPTEYRENIKWN